MKKVFSLYKCRKNPFLLHKNKNNVNLKEIDKLACTLGPGSFTGVRIGIATVKALAKVLNIDIIGATSLNLLAVEGLKQNTNHKKYKPEYHKGKAETKC